MRAPAPSPIAPPPGPTTGGATASVDPRNIRAARGPASIGTAPDLAAPEPSTTRTFRNIRALATTSADIAGNADQPSATRTFRNIRGVIGRHAGLASLLLGAVAACGFAPLALWPLALIALAAWMGLVHAAPGWRAAAWRGWLFGLGHFSVNDNWIQHAFDFQTEMPAVLGYLAPVALALYLAVYPMLAAGLAWRFFRRSGAPDGSYVAGFAGLWIVTEWLRATLFTGYAWDPLGVMWLPLIGVARLAAWVGTYALSGLAIFTAGALLLAAHRRWRMAAVLAALLAVAALADTGYPVLADPTRHVRVVQPMIGQDRDGQIDSEAMLRALFRLSGRPGATPRLLLWPEGAIRDYLEPGYPADAYFTVQPGGGYLYHPPGFTRARLAALLGPRDLLMGGSAALDFGPAGNARWATNSVYALDARGSILHRYDKAHLVPYGEYLPMRGLLGAFGLSRIIPGDLDFTAGPGPQTAQLPGFGGIGFQLCYEIIFSGRVVDAAHRPALIFNPSNDAWFGRWGPPQHLAQARMRAIEEGLPVLRATPTGVSAIVDARGRLLATVPLGRAGAIEAPLPLPLPPTLFARAGNAMAGLVALLLLLATIAMRRHRR